MLLFSFARRARHAGLAWGSWLALGPLGSAAGQVAPPARPHLVAVLQQVPQARSLALQLRRFEPAGYRPVDSLRLAADGLLTLTDRTTSADQARPALYELALDKYSRTEVVLSPREVPGCRTTVAALASQGVLWQNSVENAAYQRTLALVQHYDSLLARATERLRQLPDSATRRRLAATHALESLHRALTGQLPLVAPPGTFAAAVLARLARFPVRPDSLAYSPGYLPWLAEALAADFPLGSDEALRHYAGAGRLAQLVWQLGPLLPGGPGATAGRLLARRQGHDAVNAWLWASLVRDALARDNPAFVRQLTLDYGAAGACLPSLPPALARSLATAQALAPGQLAPALTLPDTLGQLHTLAAFARQHRYTLFYGWVSWCHTCQAETPALRALLARLGPAQLGVYAASLDETATGWAAGRHQHGPPPAGWLDVAELVPPAQSQAVQAYHIRLTPKLVLLDQQGCVVGCYQSVAEVATVCQAGK